MRTRGHIVPLVVLLAVLAAGCGGEVATPTPLPTPVPSPTTAPSPTPGDAERGAQEDDIREAVFRELMTRTGSQVYCLSVGSGAAGLPGSTPSASPGTVAAGPVLSDTNTSAYVSPSDEFMKRFAGSAATVKPESQCSLDSTNRDTQTGLRATRLMVGNVSWTGDTKAEVEGDYVCGPLCGAGFLYKLEKTGSRWEVKSVDMRWIS